MSIDLEVISYLAGLLNAGELSDFLHLVDPNIEIIDPLNINFTREEYVEYIAVMVQHVEVTVTNVHQQGNFFKIDMNVLQLETSSSYRSTFAAVANMTVENGVFVKSELIFDASEDEIKFYRRVFDTYLKKLHRA